MQIALIKEQAKRFLKPKRGQAGVIWGLVGAVVAFVVMGVTLTIGLTINDEAQEEATADSYAYNAAGKVTEGGYRLAKFAPLMGLALAGGATLTILIGSLAYFRMR